MHNDMYSRYIQECSGQSFTVDPGCDYGYSTLAVKR